MKWTSEETLVVISKLEEQITSFNNDLWKVLEEAYENKYDPPAFELDEDPVVEAVEEAEDKEQK